MDGMTIDVDTRELIAALDRLGESAQRFTMAAARVTADNVATEARKRVARATGKTAESIRVERDYDRIGYVVLSDRNPLPNLPIWIEFGTKYMTPRPYFFAAVRLEAGAHERRIAQAIQDAIDEQGLGD